MVTLKDHQQAMVDLLASGSGIPASASRLAHAMHDVLIYLNGNNVPLSSVTGVETIAYRPDATTPGLNDKLLAADVEACRIKLTGAGAGPKATPAERRVKELENTIRQLRGANAKLKDTNGIMLRENARLEEALSWHEKRQMPEQAGCRKDDTQESGLSATKGFLVPPGARFVCAQNSCSHDWSDTVDGKCQKCGETL